MTIKNPKKEHNRFDLHYAKLSIKRLCLNNRQETFFFFFIFSIIKCMYNFNI